MTPRWQARLAWAAVTVAVLSSVVAVVVAPADLRVSAALDGSPLYGVLGALIVARRANAVGWLLVVTGVSIGLTEAASMYAHRGLVGEPGAVSGAIWAAWLTTWSWLPGFVAGVLLLPLLFP